LDKQQGDAWRIWQVTGSDDGPAELQKIADHWWGMIDEPDAWVATVDGAKATRRTRRPELARALSKQAWQTSKVVKEQFPRLADEYAAAVPELTSPQKWAQQFGIEVDQ
jgi:galactofuranosylgalactofuranosylrhamnosyl-N-acetylglucosaminyl-diphospho-decaprenol beta-1,5/1,6-galactofuranosyltransferase